MRLSPRPLLTLSAAAAQAGPVARFRGRRVGRSGLWLASGHGVLLLVMLVVIAVVVLLVIRSRRS